VGYQFLLLTILKRRLGSVGSWPMGEGSKLSSVDIEQVLLSLLYESKVQKGFFLGYQIKITLNCVTRPCSLLQGTRQNECCVRSVFSYTPRSR
jgi:hypothetical protein